MAATWLLGAAPMRPLTLSPDGKVAALVLLTMSASPSIASEYSTRQQPWLAANARSAAGMALEDSARSTGASITLSALKSQDGKPPTRAHWPSMRARRPAPEPGA